MLIPRRFIEKHFNKFLAIVSQNKSAVITIVDRHGKPLFFVSSCGKTDRKQTANVPIQPYGNVPIQTIDEHNEPERPHYIPVEDWDA